jgi:hypothetical protein
MSENATEKPTGTATETATETETVKKTEQTAPGAEFTDIEQEIKDLKEPKQVYEKALNNTETETEPETGTETETEETGPDGKKVKEKAIDSELVDEGAEMMFNVSDYSFSALNSWLNKEPEKSEDYEATAKGKKLIIKNLKAYFRTYEIKITPGQALFYSYVVVYGFDFVAGLITRLKGLFTRLLMKKPTAAPAAQGPGPQSPGATAPEPTAPEPTTPPLTAEETEKKVRYLKEESYKRQKMHPCENPQCNKDEGYNQWTVKDRKFCSGSCRTTVQNKKNNPNKK